MRWITNNDGSRCLAFIPRCGSTAFGRVFINTFYPEKNQILLATKTPDGRTFDAPQLVCKSLMTPPEGAVKCALIRDPIERFRSGFTRANYETVDEAIQALSGPPSRVNIHIKPQASFLDGHEGVLTFKFPAGVAACAAALGVPTPDREKITDPREKPTLTAEQESALRLLYADDIALFDAASVG